MASKNIMPSKNIANALPPAQDLQRAFESAVRNIYEVGLTGKVSRQRTPIVQRAGAAGMQSPIDAEKRALSDAARALAQLWKVAPNSNR